MEVKMEKQNVHRIFQGTDDDRLAMRRRVLLFALTCLVCVTAAFITGMSGPENQLHYVVFAVGEVALALVMSVMAGILAFQKNHLKESVYRCTVAAVPMISVAIILCNALTVIAALVHLGRNGVEEDKIVFLLAALLLRLICMEFAHLCRKTVTNSIWTISWSVPES